MSNGMRRKLCLTALTMARMLVYNLSPSFNWTAAGFSDADLKNFVWTLAKEGFVLQLVSLAGLHSTAAVSCNEFDENQWTLRVILTHYWAFTGELSRDFKQDGMLAYVKLIQQKEKHLKCDVLTHQKWSGANYVDQILQCKNRL
jgi:isocitrate lyase